MAFRDVLALLICLPLAGQTDARLLRYLHPDAQVVIGVDWARFQNSVVWSMLKEKIGTLPIPVKGLPFLQDVDRIVLSSPGAPVGKEGKSEAPIIIAVHGHFPPDSVRKTLTDMGAHRQTYGKYTIYRPHGKSMGQDLGFVIVDPETVLIGDLGSLCAAVDRNEFSAVTPGPTMIRAVELGAINDFWAVISNPNVLANDRLQGFLAGDDMSSLGRGLEFGMSFRDGFALNVGLKTGSEAMAKHLADQLSSAIKLSMKDKPTNPALTEMAKKLKVAATGEDVSMTLHLTREEVERSTRLYEASIKNSPPKPEVHLDLTVQAPPKPAEKMVVRIEGLDGGTREVPFGHQ